MVFWVCLVFRCVCVWERCFFSSVAPFLFFLHISGHGAFFFSFPEVPERHFFSPPPHHLLSRNLAKRHSVFCFSSRTAFCFLLNCCSYRRLAKCVFDFYGEATLFTTTGSRHASHNTHFSPRVRAPLLRHGHASDPQASQAYQHCNCGMYVSISTFPTELLVHLGDPLAEWHPRPCHRNPHPAPPHTPNLFPVLQVGWRSLPAAVAHGTLGGQ